MRLNIFRLQPFFGSIIAGLVGLALISCRAATKERLQYEIFNHVLSSNKGNRTTIIVYYQSSLHEIYKSTPNDITKECAPVDLDTPDAQEYSSRKRRYDPELEDCQLGDNWMFSEAAAARLIEIMPALDPATLQSFVKRNMGPHPIDETMLSVPGVRMLTGIYKNYEEETGAKMFVELSRVGFNADCRQALVYFAIWRPSARGWFILLENIKGHWVRIAEVEAWVA